MMKRKNSLLPMHQLPNTATKRIRLSKRTSIIVGIALFFCTTIAINYLYVYRPNLATDEYSIHDPMPDPPHPTMTSLIMVPGHAIYTGAMNEAELHQDAGWVLEEFQKGGQINTFIDHIKKGLEQLQKDNKSLLIMSGGETRPKAGPLSEAQSYWEIAQHYLSDSEESIERVVTEEHARDSFENLLFSICRFYELTGNYPESITIVGFEFKKERFIKVHRAAARYPLDRFKYIGIDPANANFNISKGESENSLGPFEHDIYGCHGGLWQKKLNRNPYRRQHAYRQTCPALAPLIGYCPVDKAQVFAGTLPW